MTPLSTARPVRALQPCEWWAAPDAYEQFAALAAWLDEGGDLTLSTLREILDEPWHFELEHDAMRKEQSEL